MPEQKRLNSKTKEVQKSSKLISLISISMVPGQSSGEGGGGMFHQVSLEMNTLELLTATEGNNFT